MPGLVTPQPVAPSNWLFVMSWPSASTRNDQGKWDYAKVREAANQGDAIEIDRYQHKRSTIILWRRILAMERVHAWAVPCQNGVTVPVHGVRGFMPTIDSVGIENQ
jgi:hypothetical protein